jgi:hypothetical protein
MADVATNAAEPSPNQFPQKQGRSRSWERAIIYNPDEQTLRIKKVKKIEKGKVHLHPNRDHALKCTSDSTTKYTSCRLPSQSNCVNVFVNRNDSEDFEVTTTGGEDEKHIFIGRLNLEKLGLKDQFSRFLGQLRTLYIVKSTTPREKKVLDGDISA